ncbi:MAG: DUF3662 and FHA domain-containing protein [Acidimicrobiia bacterium]|nr:DUF3662 and FHA domain-containing protein [Acidimicrobiia bacterium]
MVRNLERRLERLVEDLAGKVFRGPLHPVELAARLVREGDLALRSSAAGPVAPNVYVIHIHPSDIGDGLVPAGLSGELAGYLEATAAERGWRLEGPVIVHFEIDEASPVGAVRCRTDFTTGPVPVWGYLAGSSQEFALRSNRLTIGRGLENDIVIDNPKVSRTHAHLWRESGSAWVADAGSANGTAVDGLVIDAPTSIGQGSVITFGSVAFTFRGA